MTTFACITLSIFAVSMALNVVLFMANNRGRWK